MIGIILCRVGSKSYYRRTKNWRRSFAYRKIDIIMFQYVLERNRALRVISPYHSRGIRGRKRRVGISVRFILLVIMSEADNKIITVRYIRKL